ncbi:hypothetical protein DKT68_12390 [Micromonospora acroterricola]|uniref:Uncharacterized protein n=1 Tax=Micromonospora acroterricola TaxID=2202421 RepID=A0A317D9N4_9ACTN|nr:hypothetical protein DKT68_12390 [Micromonospora acroterricola]
MLTLAGLTLGAGVVTIGSHPTAASAAPSEPASPTVRLEPVADDPVVVLSGTSTAVASYPRQLAVRLVNEGGALPVGTTVTLTFDQRLYAPLTPAVITMAGRQVATTSAVAAIAETGMTEYTLTLQESLPAVTAPAASAVAVVGTVRTATYPRDLLHRPQVGAVKIDRPSHQPLSRRELRPSSNVRTKIGRVPWGFELSGGWARHVWGVERQFVYFHPQSITITATGPGSAPMDTAFTVSLDPRLVQEIEVAALQLNGKRIDGRIRRVSSLRDGAAYVSRWRTSVKLKKGDVLDVRLTSRLATPTAGLTTIKHPLVEIDELSLEPSQRQTGRTTLTCLDSVWGA